MGNVESDAVLRSNLPLLNQLNRNPPPHHRRGPLQAGQRNVVLRIEQAVNLGAAVFSSVAILFLEIFCSSSPRQLQATTSLIASACASSKIPLP